MEASTFKETAFMSELESDAKIIIDTESMLQVTKTLMFEGDSHKIDEYVQAVDRSTESMLLVTKTLMFDGDSYKIDEYLQAVNRRSESMLQVTQTLMFDGDIHKIDEYLHAVDRIQQAMKSKIISHYQSHEGINVMDMAMNRLRLEFEGILKCSTDKVKDDELLDVGSSGYSSSPSTYSYDLQETDFISHGGFSAIEVDNLCRIIKRLKFEGSLADCIETYRISRKAVIDEIFRRFNIGNWSISDIRNSHWEVIVPKMNLWIRAADFFFGIIFQKEKQNYEQIFCGIEAATYDNCFLIITKDIAFQLCNFAEVVSTAPASVQKLFDVLDIYKALFVLLPRIKDTFDSVSSVSIYRQAAKTIPRLANLVRQILRTFEDTVIHEQSNTPSSGGTVHSMTSYSMECVIRILGYKQLLNEIIISKPEASLGISHHDMQFLDVGGKTPLELHLIWIIISLKSNLEGKSKHYADASLGHLFMVNNLYYIVMKIEEYSELQEMIGKYYLRKLQENIMQETYLGYWDRLLYYLRDGGLYLKVPFYKIIWTSALKRRFKIFNSTFEELCQTRSTWFVADFELRKRLHFLISETLIPAYESFLVQYRNHIEQKERRPEKYIKWSVEGLKQALDNLLLEH